MTNKGRYILAIAIAACSAYNTQIVHADADNQSIDYIPKFHGAMRASWEIDTDGGEHRFQVSNARVNMTGNIARPMDYSILVDFCEKGHVKIVDVWMRMRGNEGWAAQFGQFRMPFGIDSHRGPGNYYFANRSFIGKQVCNMRSVGLMGSWQLPGTPIDLRAGVFNTSPISDQKMWKHGVAWSVKALLQSGPWTATAGFISVNPDGLRSNMAGAGLSWHSGRWALEGEYVYENYAHGVHKATHAWNAWADYAIPVNLSWFNQWSFQARYDGMTSHVDIKNLGADAKIEVVDPPRNRITAGTTLAWIKGAMKGELRLNYEHYFYHSGVEPIAGERSKFVAEAVFKF